MHRKGRAITFLLILFFTATTSLECVSSGEDWPTNMTVITMREEFINYTITTVNGSLWAKIDGTYPLHVVFSSGPLLLFYPTPPGTINISLKTLYSGQKLELLKDLDLVLVH